MTPVINPQTPHDQAVELLEEARNAVERHFYNLRDEDLSADQLFEMRIALQDACDTIVLATRHIEQIQRTIDAIADAQHNI